MYGGSNINRCIRCKHQYRCCMCRSIMNGDGLPCALHHVVTTGVPTALDATARGAPVLGQVHITLVEAELGNKEGLARGAHFIGDRRVRVARGGVVNLRRGVINLVPTRYAVPRALCVRTTAPLMSGILYRYWQDASRTSKLTTTGENTCNILDTRLGQGCQRMSLVRYAHEPKVNHPAGHPR